MRRHKEVTIRAKRKIPAVRLSSTHQHNSVLTTRCTKRRWIGATKSGSHGHILPILPPRERRTSLSARPLITAGWLLSWQIVKWWWTSYGSWLSLGLATRITEGCGSVMLSSVTDRCVCWLNARTGFVPSPRNVNVISDQVGLRVIQEN